MNQARGAHVFVAADGAAHLVLHRRMTSAHFVVWYCGGRPSYGLAPFSTLLDVLPIHTAPVPGLTLPLLPVPELTVQAWLAEAWCALTRTAPSRHAHLPEGRAAPGPDALPPLRRTRGTTRETSRPRTEDIAPRDNMAARRRAADGRGT